MPIKIESRTLSDAFDEHKEIVILPANYSDGMTDPHQYSSTSISFKKYAEGTLPIRFLADPEILYERHSSEWFGPDLLVTAAALASNPHLISIACGVLANYLTEIFKGKGSPTVKLRVLYKKTATTETREIVYEGDIAGLALLEDAVKNISTDDK